MPRRPQKRETSGRTEIIGAVKTYLGFLVLLVLVAEATFGALALQTSGGTQIFAVSAMLFVTIVLIAIVCFFAYVKPEALLSSGLPREADEFRRQISGYWWERIIPDVPSALSFVEVSLDTATNGLILKGQAYSRSGELPAIWDTMATCINSHDRKVFYYWRGWHPSRPQEPYEGFGEISFHEARSNVIDMKSTTRKSADFRRSTDEEATQMRSGNGKLIADLVRIKLDHWP